MIRFFGKIRQRLLSENKISKYLTYAAGEIILVVLGILIALQINIWNEHRKELRRTTSFLIKMLEEVKSDIEFLASNDSLYASFESSSAQAIEEFYRSETIEDFLAADSIYAFKWRNLHIKTSTYDEMLSTGSLYNLENKTLQAMISSYYYFIEAQQYYIEQINIQTQKLYLNPQLNSLKFLAYSSDHPDKQKLDMSWIGDVNSPTFLALDQFYRYNQTFSNKYRRRVIQSVLSRSYDLLNEIEKELNK